MTFWKTVGACMIAGILNAIIINSLAVIAWFSIFGVK